MGVQTSAPFTNTYSLQFDGIDDYVSLDSPNYPNAISFSAWFKTTDTSTQAIWTALDNTTQKHFLRISSTQFRLRLTDSAGALLTVDNTLTTQDGNWHHVAFTTDGTTATDGVVVYLDGVALSNKGTLANSGLITTNKNNIGTYAATTWNFNGNIDEISLYNSELSESDITDIYHSGTPTDLTDLSPVAWFRNGDNGAWKSPQWLIPNNSNKDKVSNYSFEFDGVDDYISVTANPLTDFTVSFWIKPNSAGASYEGILGQGTTSAQGGILRYVAWNSSSVSGTISLFLGSWTNISGTVTNGVWTNIVLTYDSSSDELKSYNNGSLYTTISSPNFSAQTTNAHSFERIGLRNGVNSSAFGGQIDEVALWDSALTDISSIYSGGEPTTITGAVAYWRLGDEATFSGGVWTVPDSVGSNDGTSNAMTIEDRVGDAPNSANNGLSQNMDEVDRVEDTP